MPSPRSATRRRALFAAVPHPLAVLPTIVLLITEQNRFPDPLASHFVGSGTADGFASRQAIIVMAVLLGIGMALVFALTAGFGAGAGAVPKGGVPRAAISRYDVGRWLVGLSWAVAAFLGVVIYGATAANLDLADAALATLPGWLFPIGIAAAVAGGVVGGLISPRTPPPSADAGSTPVPAVRLGRTEQVSWSRTIGSSWPLVAGGLLIAAAIALGVLVEPIAGIGAGIGGVLVLLFGSVRLTVDRRGLTVAFGPLGWPHVRVPAEDVESATVGDVSPRQFGGWGYRIIPGGSGVILRSGPALIVERRSGNRFVVTMDDPRTAAGLLNGIAAKSR